MRRRSTARGVRPAVRRPLRREAAGAARRATPGRAFSDETFPEPRGPMGMTLRPLPIFVVLGLVLLLAGGARTQTARAGETPRTLTVLGRAELQASPDRAVVMVSVRTRGKSAGDAAKENARRSEAVLGAVRPRLDPADRTETGAYRIEPVHEYQENRAPRIVAYDAVNTLRIETRRVADLGPLLDAVTAAADASVDAISFELADPNAKQAEALERAAQAARVRAARIAQGLGVRLGRIVEAREAGASAPPPPMPMMRGAEMKAADVPTQILPQELRVAAEVEVRFEIE